jgi:hypothetical protein
MLKRTLGKLAVGWLVAAGGLLSVAGVASAAPAHGDHAQRVVDCGSIDNANGGWRYEVYAVPTDAGTVGCTEAFNVIDQYFRDLPYAEGTALVEHIHGWTLMTDTGTYGSYRVGAENEDGLAFYANPIAES